MIYTIEQMCSMKESQVFDRKSARKEPKALSNHLVAFANADGGTLVIGIEDKGTITGIDGYPGNINELLRVPFDFCKPSIRISTETVECIDEKGNPNHILVITIPQSSELHANYQDEVFYRMGDKSQRLNFDERLQLMYAKGSRYYEDEPVFRSSLDDIDMDFVAQYCKKIGYGKSPEEYIRQNNAFVVQHDGREEMSGAALLLFGKNPQQFFPRARVRFIRYEGTEAKVGTQMNVIKDVNFDGRVLDLVRKTLDFVKSQVKERTKLGPNAQFVTIPEYPEFAWTELIVNAVAHRDYSISGTDIQVKMFDNRIVVESPGLLPGIVRISNFRTVHFSRNPKIAEFLHQYSYVKEFGEGIDRMFMEMEKAGLPAPEYQANAFMLTATIRNDGINDSDGSVNVGINVGTNVGITVADKIDISKLKKSERNVYQALCNNGHQTTNELANQLQITTRTVERALKGLREKGLLERDGSNKSGAWKIL